MSTWLPKASIYSSIDDDTLPSRDLEASRPNPFNDDVESQHLRSSAVYRRPARSLHGLLGPGSGTHGRQQYHALGPSDVVAEDEEEDGGPPRSFMYEGSTVHDTPRSPDSATSPPAVPTSRVHKSHPPDTLANESEAAFATNIPRRPAEETASPARSRSLSPSTSPPLSFTQGSPGNDATLEPGLYVGGDRGQSAYEVNRDGLSRKDRALWRWVNTVDLDVFLMEVYAYYSGKGVWCIALSRFLNLLTVGFVIAFSTFLMGCIDYSVLQQRKHLSDVIVPRCVSRFHGGTLLLALAFGSFWAWRAIQFGKAMQRLWDMRAFFEELLEVPEADIQTIPWHVIVERLTALRASHPSSLAHVHQLSGGASVRRVERLDAHDVANRIMREENYLIALFNRDILDLSAPLPEIFAGRRIGGQLTRLLEWNIRFCLLGFLFGPDGQVRRAFTSERNRAELSEALVRRFRLMACINGILALFVLVYLVLYSFFRYFEEYRNTPASIGSRNFTQLARWKFREFNELPHVFATRLRLAEEPASAYVDQFPKEKTVLVARFVAFVTGSFAAVLLVLTLFDPDAFLHFEITKDRTVIFYLGVFTAILAVSRGMIPSAETIAADPVALMRTVTEHTHYMPEDWAGQLHSAEVYAAFGQLYQLRLTTLAHELLSVLVAPFVLGYTLPPLAPRLIDFFREFTVHVDGLGYVCSFAEFNFKRQGNAAAAAAAPVPTGKAAAVLGAADLPPTKAKLKLEMSMLGFAQAHPNWQPEDDGAASMLISRANTAAAKAREYERAFQRASSKRPAMPRASSTTRRRAANTSGQSEDGRPPTTTGPATAATTTALIDHDEAGLGASYVEPLSLDESALPPSSAASPRGREQSFLGLLTQAQRSW